MLMTLGSMPEITAPLRSMETARMARPIWVRRMKSMRPASTTQLTPVASRMFTVTEMPSKRSTPRITGHMVLGAAPKITTINACMTTASISVDISTAIGLSSSRRTRIR